MHELRLNMWNIYHRLSSKNMTPLITEGEQTIVCAKWIVSSFMNKNAVFVGKASEYFDVEDDVSILAHRHDMIIVRDREADELFDEVSNIIEEFLDWDKRLRDIYENEEDGLQKMIDCSEEILNHPSFIYGPDGSALAISKKYSGSIHWHWNDLLENHGLTTEKMKQLQTSIHLSEVFLDDYPTVRDSRMGNHQYMHCSLFANNYMAGHYVLFSMNAPFEKGLENLMHNVVIWGSRYMKKHYEQYSSTSWIAANIKLMMIGRKYDSNDLTNIMDTLRWDLCHTYRIYVIEEAVEKAPVLLANMYLFLTENLKSAIVMQSDNQLTILENETLSNKKVTNLLLNTIFDEGFICGESMPFNHILQCNLYYAQAKEELNRAKSRRIPLSVADDNAVDHYKDFLRSDDLKSSYINYQIRVLHDYDQKNGTQYIQTIKAYCYCGFQLSDAAKHLGVHRNTVNYRVERMREIIDFSFFDELRYTHDEKIMSHLFLSFILLENDK